MNRERKYRILGAIARIAQDATEVRYEEREKTRFINSVIEYDWRFYNPNRLTKEEVEAVLNMSVKDVWDVY